MTRVLRLLVVLLPGLFAAMAAPAQSLVAVPKLESRVTDVTGTLTAAQQAELEQKLLDFERRKGAQVALLMVPTTAPEEIEQYSIRVAEAWKLGREKPDDGVLLLVALQDRRMRIEIGYGLEGVLTDALSRRIIADTITPLFRQGDYFGGVSAGLQQIMGVIEGEALPPPDRGWQHPRERISGLLPVLFVLVLVGGSVMRSVLGRTAGSLVAAGAVTAIAWALSQALVIALLAGFAALFFTLLGGLARAPGLYGGGWGGGLGGGGFGGGGFGGFGGGGFSGGGGSFGGGGASGSW